MLILVMKVPSMTGLLLVDLLSWFEEAEDRSAVLTAPVRLLRFRKVKPTKKPHSNRYAKLESTE